MTYYKGNLGSNEKILEYLQVALEIQEELGDNRGQATTLLNIGSFYIEKHNDYEKAIKSFIKVYNMRIRG